jgi:hypothetical protein
MKKIKLDSSKLNLKKQNIGNLLSGSEMKHIIGGYGQPTENTCGIAASCGNPTCTPAITMGETCNPPTVVTTQCH